MEELVIKYLNYGFYPMIGKVFIRDEVNKKSQKDKRIYAYKLSQELYKVFHLEEEYLEEIIDNWLLSKYPEFDLDNFWTEIEVLFPEITRVPARLIANDLVPVEPLGGPIGDIHYPFENGGVRLPEENIFQVIPLHSTCGLIFII